MQLPFHKWSLKFHNIELERDYLQGIKDESVLYFRLIAAVIILQSITLLISNIITKATLLTIILNSMLVFLLIFFTITVRRFKKHSSYFYFLLYAFFQLMSYWFTSQKLDEKYMVGFCVGITSNVILQFLNLKLKLFIILLLTPIKITLLHIFLDEAVSITILQYSTQIIALIFCYKYEFNQRAMYCEELFRSKEISFFQDHISQSILIITFNNRSQSFALEYCNKAAEEIYGVKDTDTLKELCRHTYLLEKQQGSFPNLHNFQLNKSNDISLRQKRQTLEEYAFKLLTDQTDNFMNSVDLFTYVQVKIEKGELQKMVNLCVKPFIYNSKSLVLLFQEERVSIHIEKASHQVKFLNKIINVYQNTVTGTHIQLFKLISQLNYSDYKLSSLKSYCLTALNYNYNFQFFLNQDKLQAEASHTRLFRIVSLLDSILPHLQCLTHLNNRRFQCQFNLLDLRVRINDKLFIQILLNVLQLVLELSNKNSIITLLAQLEDSPDPQSMIAGSSHNSIFHHHSNNVHSSKSGSLRQQIIKYSFIFNSSQFIDIEKMDNQYLNPQTNEEFAHNNKIDFNIRIPITNLLIDKVGPYQRMVCESREIGLCQDKREGVTLSRENTNGEYSNQLIFYVYTDYNQLALSYSKIVQQKSFLEF